MQNPLAKLKTSLSTQIFLGLALGIFTGLFLGESASVFSFIGDIFLRLFQMPVIPYIVVSIISSLGRLSYQDARSIFTKGGIILLLFWAIVLVIVSLMPLGFPSWQSSAFFSTSLLEPNPPLSLIELFIPKNPFNSMANTIVPSLVLFCIATGLSLITIENKQGLLAGLDTLTSSLLKITQFVSKLTPYGVFAIVANSAGTLPLEAFKRLGVYIVIQATLALILSFWVLPRLISVLTPLKFKDIINAYRTPLITAFAAANLLIVLPLIIDRSRELLLTLKAEEERDTLTIDAPLEVLVPVSFTFPSMGKLIALGFIPFAGWYSGNSLPLNQYPQFLITGLASLFGDGITTMQFLLNLFGIPLDMVQVFVTLEQLSSARFGTLLAGMNTIALALITTCWLNGYLTLRLRKVIRFGVVSFLSILLALGSIHALFTYGLASTYTQNEKLEQLQLLRVQNASDSVKVYLTPPPPDEQLLDQSRLEQIQERRTLRACYSLLYPLAYFNKQTSPELVGFSVEIAHLLANDLGVGLELVPVDDDLVIGQEARLLNVGYCDISINSVPITPRLASQLAFSDPIDDYTLAFLVKDQLKEKFSSWQSLRNVPDLKIGSLSDVKYYQAKVQGFLPDAEIVPITSFETLLIEDSPIDTIVVPAETGAAWTILNPEFTIAIPKPIIAVPVSYGLPYDAEGLLRVVNAWLRLKQRDGTIKSLYDYWIQGKTKAVEPPRWSIMRNVLGWQSS